MISVFCKAEEIKQCAITHGYRLIDEQPKSHLMIFINGSVQLNVWTGRRGPTVATILAHPRKGRNALYRRHISNEDLERIFKNPRTHVHLGYRKR